MKKIFTLALSLIVSGYASAQSINFEQVLPTLEFQDADAGDLTFVDVDNDGDQDLMVTGKGGPVLSTLYINDGEGNFVEAPADPFVDVFGGTVEFGDVNGDGLLDLLITGSTSSPLPTANLYFNQGGGNFVASLNVPFEPSKSSDVDFGDIDGDGDLDVIMTGNNIAEEGFSTLYINNGSGVFSEVMGTSFEGLRNSAVAFFDADGDIDLDLIFSGLDENDMPFTGLFLNDGNGAFTLDGTTPFPGCDLGDIAVADADNDGDIDVMLCGATATEQISFLYENNGAGAFSLVAGTPFPGSVVGETHFADFDNDGDNDVLITGSSTVGVIANIYENQGGNVFVLAEELAGAYLSSAAVGDMDGDNDLDVIIGGTSFTAPTRSTKVHVNQLFDGNNGVVPGCTNSNACNYNPLANQPDDSCEYSCYGCTDSEAANYNETHTVDDGSCVYCSSGCKGDFNDDGAINANDLLSFLGVFGATCE